MVFLASLGALITVFAGSNPVSLSLSLYPAALGTEHAEDLSRLDREPQVLDRDELAVQLVYSDCLHGSSHDMPLVDIDAHAKRGT